MPRFWNDPVPDNLIPKQPSSRTTQLPNDTVPEGSISECPDFLNKIYPNSKCLGFRMLGFRVPWFLIFFLPNSERLGSWMTQFPNTLFPPWICLIFQTEKYPRSIQTLQQISGKTSIEHVLSQSRHELESTISWLCLIKKGQQTQKFQNCSQMCQDQKRAGEVKSQCHHRIPRPRFG